MLVMRPLIILGVAAFAAIQIPQYFAGDDPSTPPLSPKQPVLQSAASGYSIKANSAGHFESRFRFNGKAVEGIVDTGATYIAMNEETANRLGIAGDRLRFLYAVQTANGEAKAARVMLDSVEIGSIRVRNVDALVLRDTSLSSVLIGMSFMKKLSFYKVENGRMLLSN